MTVTVVLDQSQRTAKFTSAMVLFNAGIPVFIDSRHAIAHNKIILIDGETILTGSFNFSNAAEQSNAENLLILEKKPALYAAYADNFQQHVGHSDRYEGAVGVKDAALSL